MVDAKQLFTQRLPVATLFEMNTERVYGLY